MKKGLLIFVTLLFVNQSFAQKQGKELIDSLVMEIPRIVNDTLKIRLYKRIADEYFYVDTDKAMLYSRVGLKLAYRMKWSRATAVFISCIGRSYSDKGKYDSSMYFFRRAYSIHYDSNDKMNMAAVLNNMGAAEQNLSSNFPEATKYYLRALKLAESLDDQYLITLCFDNISRIYFTQSDYPKALAYGFKSLKLCEELADSPRSTQDRSVANALSNIAAIYTDMKEMQKAKTYYDKALPLLEKLGNLEGQAKAYSNLSILAKTDFPKKTAYALKAEKLWNEVNPMHLEAVNNLGNLGAAYLEMAQSDSLRTYGNSKNQLLVLAKSYLEKAIRLSNEKGEVNSTSYFKGNLSEVQANLGDYKNAYLNFRAYQAIQDSLFSQENKNKIATLEGKREVELRDKQLEINRLELEAQSKQRLGLIGGLILIGSIGGLLYWQNQARKQANIQLLHLNAELDEANKVKTRFFAILSHDLRSPVANLINFLNLQKEAPGMMSKEMVDVHQKRISESAEGLLENMESMLLWSKGQMDNFKPNAKLVEVDDLFSYVEKFFAGTPGVAMSFSNPQKLTLVTDEDYLKTIMQNLSSNALKALKTKSDGQIHWEAKSQDDHIILSVADNGPGASSRQLSALFSDETAIGIKTGLGLHLVRDLAKAIECKIEVRSEIGDGMEFYLKFTVT